MQNTEDLEGLVQQLRASPEPQERRQIALGLAAQRSDRALAELYRMARGEVIGFSRFAPRTWQTLWRRRVGKKYSLADQLNAINALAEAGVARALEFLRQLCVEASVHPSDSWGSEWTYAARDHRSIGARIYVTYPNARGALADSLAYSYELDDDNPDGPTSTRNLDLHSRLAAALTRAEELCGPRDERKGEARDV